MSPTFDADEGMGLVEFIFDC